MSVRTENVINKTFADSAAADLFFSERNSFGKTYQFIYQLETEPDNLYYIDETVDNPILLTGSAVYSVNDKTGVVVLSTSDISEATNKKYVTDAQLTIIGNTSGTNTGDNAINSQYSGLVSNATHTGEVTGATALIVDKTAISNKTAATIVGTDYVLFGDSSDSNNLKKGLVSDIIAAASGGAVALDKITDATDTSTIDNANYKQEWQWNTHVSGSAFKLSTNLTSAHTPSAGSAVFEANLSNSYQPSFSGTNYAAKFINSYSSAGLLNTAIAGYFETVYPSGGVHSAVYAKGNIRIEASTGKLFFGQYARIFGQNGNISFSPGTAFNNDAGSYNYGMEAGNSTQVVRNYSSQPYYNWQTSYMYKDISTSRQLIAFGVDADLYTTNGVGTSYGWIERSADKLMFAAQAGLSSRTQITPNYLLTLYGTNNNVGIGTTTPVESASLEISSTTKGFLPPRMTATQASAIASPAKSLIVYVTDTNGTFTSAGIWIYTTSWKLILAE